MPEPRHNKGKSKQDYRTPPEFLTAVKERFGIWEDFDCDLAASKTNAVCPTCYTAKDNALVQSWNLFGGWNWCNPPFADIKPWVEKAYASYTEEGARTILLLPAGVGANWFRDWVHRKALVIFINGRLTFVGADDPYPKDLMLVIHGMGIGYATWTWKTGDSSAALEYSENGR